MNHQRILSVGLDTEQDVVLVRQRARQVSGLLGFSQQDQVRIATAVSEVARGACQRRLGGRAVFALRHLDGRQHLEVAISAGAGFELAIVTAHRLMDACSVENAVDRPATVLMRKALPPQSQFGPAHLASLAVQLAASPVANTFAEVAAAEPGAGGHAGRAARTPGRPAVADARTGRHQPRHRRAVRRNRGQGRPAAPRRRDEVALPVEYRADCACCWWTTTSTRWR